jgi:hypothetical protein
LTAAPSVARPLLQLLQGLGPERFARSDELPVL